MRNNTSVCSSVLAHCAIAFPRVSLDASRETNPSDVIQTTGDVITDIKGEPWEYHVNPKEVDAAAGAKIR